MISFFGVLAGTAAMVIILSVFNGLEGLVGEMYNNFNPDLKIEAAEGKYFEYNDALDQKLKSIEGIESFSVCLEENGLLKYGDNQELAKIKGVDEAFFNSSLIEETLIYGSGLDYKDDKYGALLGNGIAYKLSIAVNDPFTPVKLYIPKRGKVSQLNPTSAFNSGYSQPAGIFDVQPEINNQYCVVPLELMRELFDDEKLCSSIEFGIDKNQLTEIKEELKLKLGDSFEILDRKEQQKAIYKIFRLEKWAAFVILCFIIFLAAMNLIGSLTMLVIDKKKDISIISAMGGDEGLVQKIFLQLGLLISVSGIIFGLLLGLILCLLQIYFGLIEISSTGNFIVQSYPIAVKLSDLAIIIATVFGMGLICSLYPSVNSRKYMYSIRI